MSLLFHPSLHQPLPRTPFSFSFSFSFPFFAHLCVHVTREWLAKPTIPAEMIDGLFGVFSLSASKGLRLIDSPAHPYVFIRVRPRAWIRMQRGRHFHKRMYLACTFARQPGRKNADAIKSLGVEGLFAIVSRSIDLRNVSLCTFEAGYIIGR